MFRSVMVTAALVAGSFAQANNGQTLSDVYGPETMSSQMTRMFIDENLAPKDSIVSGNLTVSPSMNQATLMLIRKSNCPPKALCLVGLPAPIIVKLPVISVKTDRCNNVTIIAEKNEMPVDGVRGTITIRDFTANTCRFRPEAPTYVQYETEFYNRMNGEPVQTHSTLFGTALEAIVFDR